MWPSSFFSRRKRARCSWDFVSLQKGTFSVDWRWPFSIRIGPGPLRRHCEPFPVWRGFSRGGPISWSWASSTPGNRPVPCASGRVAPLLRSRLSARGWRRRRDATEVPFLCLWLWRRPSPLPYLTGWGFPFRPRRPRATASILPRRRGPSRDGPMSRGTFFDKRISRCHGPAEAIASRRLLFPERSCPLLCLRPGRDLPFHLPYNDSNGLNREQWG